ncbi:MAG: hypothetical protein LIO54_05615 [Oscillospiraceae bacterium]|nr:hypothetical protein [Oscillospiraceae bacterium]
MKKQQIVALAVGLCAVGTLFTGCHMRHEWTAATCTEPETCAVGGETRGEALGHTWVEATCTEPKTCSVCGATEGEALGHTWTEATSCIDPAVCTVCGAEGEALAHTFAEANYQQPATCTVCGETEGDVLPAEFDTYGLSCDAVAGEAYTYKTVGSTDSSVEVIGTVTFQEPEIVDGCEYFETPDGYVCEKVTILMSFDDSNARSYGIQWSYCMEDYYAIVAHDDSGVTDDNGVLTCTVSWNGVDYTECHTYLAESSGQWDDSVFNTKITFYYSLPDGYDGAVLGVCNPSVEWEEGMHIFDVDNTDMVLYRLPALTAAN